MITLSIDDQDGPLEIGFEDLKKFHGTRSICGLTVGFTILSAAWPHLSAGQPLARDTIEIETGFPGPGARDAFEMITRAVSREAYHIRTGIFQQGAIDSDVAKLIHQDHCFGEVVFPGKDSLE